MPHTLPLLFTATALAVASAFATAHAALATSLTSDTPA
jgi:hypothetical protein